MTFLSDCRSSQFLFIYAHESTLAMYLPLVLLAIGSIFIGYLFKDAIIGIGTDFMGESIYVRPIMIDNIIDAEHIAISIKLLPVILSLGGAILALYLGAVSPILSLKLIKKSNIIRNFYFFLINK
jgi:NADH-ubiquinone oxidoreductase chain 5